VAIRISAATWLSLFLLGFALWFTATYIDILFELTWILFGALLLGLAMRPIATKLSTWHIPRGITVAGIYAGLFVLIATLMILMSPVIRDDWTLLQNDGPLLWQQVQSRLTGVAFDQWLPSADTISRDLVQALSAVLNSAIGTLTGLGRLLLDLLVIMILAYFYTTELELEDKIIDRWIPLDHQPRVRQLFLGVQEKLALWVWAQGAFAVLSGIVFGLLLALMGVPFAWTIGLIAGLLSVIPYLGAIIATFLGALSALSVGPWLALWVVILFTAIFVVESHVLAPIVYGRAIGLRSAVVLLALFIGAKAQGIVGIFFAIPIVVVLAAIGQELQYMPPAVEVGPPKTAQCELVEEEVSN